MNVITPMRNVLAQLEGAIPIVSGDRRSISKSILVLYLFCVLIIGGVLAFRVTPMSGLDESYHYKRALEISEGHLFALALGPNQWGAKLDVREVAFEHWFDLLRNANRPATKQGAAEAQAHAESMPRGREMHWFASTATYPPVPYLPSAAGLWASRTLHLHFLHRLDIGRLANLVTYVTLVGLIVTVLPAGRLVVMALLTTPTLLHLASTFSADPLTNALPILFAAFCLRLRGRERRLSFASGSALFTLGLTLGLLKLTCFVASGAILLVPLSRYQSPAKGWSFRVGLMAGCIELALAWNATYPFVPGKQWHPGSDPAEMMRLIHAAPLHTIKIFVRTIESGTQWWWTDAYSRFGGGPGLYFFKIEGPFPWLGAVLVAMLLLVDPRQGRSTYAAALLLLLAFAYGMLVLLAFFVGFSAPQDAAITGLQGRYFMLPMVLAAIGLSLLLPRYRTPHWVGHSLLVAYLVVTVSVVVSAIDRYTPLWS